MIENEIRVTLPGGMRVDAEYKGFVFKTDQPPHSGGDGSAPAPFDHFLASIATCAGFYVLAFCRERKIPTENIRLVMGMERNPQKKMIGKINIWIELPPDFPDKYKNAVIKAVDTCSVKAHMLDPPVFEIQADILK